MMKIKKGSFLQMGAKLVDAAERFRDSADKFSNILAIGLVVTVLVGTLYGTVRSQSDVYIDVMGTYTSDQDKVVAVTGDEGQNVQTGNAANTDAALLNVAVHILGTEGTFGEAATLRAQEMGIPETERMGLLALVDNETMSMLNSPGISIPAHLANQWLPQEDSTSTSVYAQSSGQSFTGTEQAYLFLRDFVGLEEVWEMFRNFAYAGFVLVIMGAGFMIIFRGKINGQTTVNVMNSLPNVLVGLLLVTFSFALSGFILDMGRLFAGMLASYMGSSLGGFQPTGLSDPFHMFLDAFGSANPLSNGLISGLGGGSFLRFIFALAMPLVGILTLLVTIAIAFAALYASFKIFMMLLMTYIKIFIDVVLGPIYMMMGAVPGQRKVIEQWIKRMIAAALVFPVTFLIINLGRYIGERTVGSGMVGAIQYLSGGEGSEPLINISGMFVIAAYFIAAGTPGIVNDIINVDESKGVSAAIQGAKQSAGKIPFVGGLMG